MASHAEVIIIGAGVAGLAAACELGRAGVPVSIVEARERIGGRVFTERIPKMDFPIEFGAEFIHGRPPEIWDRLNKAGVRITEVDGDSWCVEDEGLKPCGLFSEVDQILEKMDDLLPDESFLQFLNRCFPNSTPEMQQAADDATTLVSGFNAADPALVGVRWLVKGMRADEEIEGDRAFRARHGYADLIDIFQRELERYGVSIRTGAVVKQIQWGRGNVELKILDRAGSLTLASSRVLITVPLSILQASENEPASIQFVPPLPEEKLVAMQRLEMGKVIRIVLRFKERFWDTIRPQGGGKSLADLSFLFTEDKWFPTWWSTMPEKYPIMTGWAPFKCAERLAGKEKSFITERAVQSLSKALGVGSSDVEKLLVEAFVHDWESDPFSRGAYSYAKVGADGAQEALGSPLEDTLFFAGEATDTSGHNGTVHGAIASGKRAAGEILRAMETGSSRTRVAS